MAPVSPYALLQEQVPRDLHYPWRVIVSCALLNRTTGTAAHKAAGELFMLWPDPDILLYWVRHDAELAALRDILRPLGLVNRREALLLAMTDDYARGVAPYVCRGVGDYARDALDVFCAGELPEDAADHYLKLYVEWRRRERAERIEWDEAGHAAHVASLRN